MIMKSGQEKSQEVMEANGDVKRKPTTEILQKPETQKAVSQGGQHDYDAFHRLDPNVCTFYISMYLFSN